MRLKIYPGKSKTTKQKEENLRKCQESNLLAVDRYETKAASLLVEFS